MAKPQTIVRDGSGTRSVTYQLPPGLFQYIESVLVSLSNGAAVAVRPTLKVETVNGRVMATKRQGESVPAGDTGTATWALRLTDEGGAGIQFDVENAGDWLHVTANGSAVPQSGTIVLDAENADPVTGGRVTLYAGGAFGIIQLFSENSIDIRADGDGTFEVDGNFNCAWGNWQGSADIWQMNFGETALGFFADASFSARPSGTANFFFQLRAGGKFEIDDENGNPIFRVDENGDLHGKTGKTLAFDL